MEQLPTHQTAMKIRYRKATLHHFPPAGKRWKWSKVVGNESGKVDPSAADAVSAYLQRHEDGRYSVEEQLAEYLHEKYSITLKGSETCPEQQSLPGVESPPSRESMRLDGGVDGPRDYTGESRQVSFDGEDVTSDVQTLEAEQDMRERERAADQTWASRAERSARDTQQARLTAYASPRVGMLHRPAGSVYSSASAVS